MVMIRDSMLDGDLRDASTRRGTWLVGGIAVAVVLGLCGLITAQARQQARQDEAYDLVVTWKNRLSADKDEKGSWKQWPSPLPDEDPWGNPLRVLYERDKHTVRLTVSSDGPDGRQFSPDDLKASESDTDWVGVAKDGAGAVEEVAGATTRGLVGGAIEGVTDHIPKKLRDKAGIPSSRDEKDAEKN